LLRPAFGGARIDSEKQVQNLYISDGEKEFEGVVRKTRSRAFMALPRF